MSRAVLSTVKPEEKDGPARPRNPAFVSLSLLLLYPRARVLVTGSGEPARGVGYTGADARLPVPGGRQRRPSDE
ncbi:hypothetical protein GCM10007147_19870 [Nocardiopsis kunsanensis]|uniref:Uncharacterized protein n=1 Tax=Nocardiopsis kunsanensis TaxID=141693 RepID=A0A918XC59_9ACTN|nr:hypothetical protein GCM10007147_19870 [Nocardiopsis kunsanensis]